MMIPSLNLELKIYKFAEFAGKAQWQVATLGTLSSALQYNERSVLIDALDDLFERKYMEYRQWDSNRNDWAVYNRTNLKYSGREFQLRVTFSGRKYFEMLETQATEPSRSSDTIRTDRAQMAAERIIEAGKQELAAQSVLAVGA